MANKRDVELLIKARDDTGRALSSAKQGLADLFKTLEKGAEGAAGGGLFGALVREVKTLDAEFKALTGFAKVSQDIKRAEESVNRLDSAVQKAKASARTLREEYGRATENLRRTRQENQGILQSYDSVRAKVAQLKDELRTLRTSQGPAAKSFKVFEGENMRRELTGLQDELRKIKPLAEGAAKSIAAAEAQQSKLRSEAASATRAFNEQRASLGRLRTEMVGLSSNVGKAQSALGGIALNQEAIAAATGKAAGEIAKVTAALERQKAASEKARVSNTVALPQSAELQNVFAARQAFVDAQRQVAELGRQLRATAQPTDELRRAYLLAQDAVRQTSVAYRNQLNTIGPLIERKRQLQQATQNTATIERALSAARASSANLASRAASDEFRLAEASRNVANAKRNAAAATNGWAEALRRADANQRQTLSFTQRLRGEIIALTTAYFGLFGAYNQVGSVVEAFRAVEAVQNRLGAVFNQDTQKVAQEVAFLRDQALRLGISFQTLGDEYSKFAVAARQANFSQVETRKIFLSVAEAGRVNKLSVSQMGGVFLALQQMISKGKVTAEELTRQLGDRLPGAANIFADALGVSTAELFEMLRAGEVLATNDTMLKFAEQLDRRFGKQLPASLESLTANLDRFSAIMFEIKAQIGEAGFAENLRLAFIDLNAALQGDGGTKVIIAISDALSALINIVRVAVENIDTLTFAFKVFLSFKIAQGFIAIGASALQAAQVIAGAATAMLTASRAAAATGGALAALRAGLVAVITALGPFGIAFALAGTAVAATSSWATGINGATSAIERHIDSVIAAKNAYGDTTQAVGEFARSVSRISVTQAQNQVEELERQMRKLREAVRVPLRSPQVLQDAIAAFKEGRISALEYKKALDDLAQADPRFDENGTATFMLEAADAAIELEERLGVARDLLKQIKGAAEQAKKPLQEATPEIDGAKLKESTEALGKLKDMFPEIGKEIENLNNAQALPELLRKIQQVGPLTAEAMKLIQEVQQKAIDDTVGGNFIDRLIAAESGGNASARNPNSTAVGAGQFIESTWLRMFKQYFPDRAKDMTDAMILALREDASLSKSMVALYARENAAVLQQAGVAVNEAALSLAHFLGPSGAVAVLTAAADTPLDQILSKAVIEANKGVLQGKTAGDLAEWAAKRVGYTKEELAVVQSLQKKDEERAQNARKFAEEQQSVNDNLRFEAENAARAARDQAIENGLRDYKLAAQRAGIELTDAEIAQRRELIAANYDAVNAERIRAEEVKRVEESVNDLMERRRLLMEQIEFYQGQGNVAAVEQLTGQLAVVDEQFRAAIEKAIAFWEAVGGAEAQNKILALQSLSNQIQKTTQLTAISGKQINDNLINGAVSGFDRLAQAVANGENAVDAMRDAFLQFAADFLREIAQMILKQALLNALGGSTSGGAGGGGIGGFIAGAIGAIFRHDGGLVNSSGMRSVHAGHFAKAMRYHGGGIAGLKPNEVPAVLERGEEVLTADDPRHVANGGGGAKVKIVNAFDSGGFLTAALNSTEGEQAILNFVRNNPSAFKSAMEG